MKTVTMYGVAYRGKTETWHMWSMSLTPRFEVAERKLAMFRRQEKGGLESRIATITIEQPETL